jgi:hypothetical protein
MTWNANNMTFGQKENILRNILETNDIDLAVITEAELPYAYVEGYNITGYTAHFPFIKKDSKARVFILVKNKLASLTQTKTQLMTSSPQTVWVEAALPSGTIILGGIYRTWTAATDCTVLDDLNDTIAQMEMAATGSKHVIIMGDFNIDLNRLDDTNFYSQRGLLNTLTGATSRIGLEYLPTGNTYKSHGKYHHQDGTHDNRQSRIDHVYTAGVNARARTLLDKPTDHWPVIVTVLGRGGYDKTTTIRRRNFKALTRPALELSLSGVDWSPIYDLADVDKIASFITNRITETLDLICPMKTIRVRKGDSLYLSVETRRTMAARDTPGLSKAQYQVLRNEACKMVKRDRTQTNLTKLRESPDDQRLLWKIARQSLGTAAVSLPASIITPSGRPTVDELDAATTTNLFLVEKVKCLRAKIPKSLLVQISSQNNDNVPQGIGKDKNVRFAFSFAGAGRIAKVIKSLNNSQATGLDGIPVKVLKLGTEVLAAPIARLVNVSLSSGKVPRAFMKAIVLPVHKGKSKPHSDPASYRLVALLPTMSKVLESVVKEDLEAHFAATDALPDSQFGFREERSTTIGLAAAHASWLEASTNNKTSAFGVLAFDLTAAFDTVDKAQLIPKLRSLGVGGVALDWFTDYLSGGEQAVLWNETRSSFIKIVHGVRQGSILSGLLFTALMADMPLHVGKDLTSYADDTCIWALAPTLDGLKSVLEAKAAAFAYFAASCGLVLNSSKMQLLIAGKKTPTNFYVTVDGCKVSPATELELLGVRFDRNLSTLPQQKRLAASTRQRASLIARLSHHLPRGPLLQQLAHGLVMGKVGYATSTFVRPRTDSNADPHSADLRAAQVAINDVARTLTGKKRKDHVQVSDLLKKAKLPSINQVTVKSTAIEAWKAYHSHDGNDNGRNMLGKLLFGDSAVHDQRHMRSSADGKILIPLRGQETFVAHAAAIWNSSIMLREASSKSEASAIARAIALDVP